MAKEDGCLQCWISPRRDRDACDGVLQVFLRAWGRAMGRGYLWRGGLLGFRAGIDSVALKPLLIQLTTANSAAPDQPQRCPWRLGRRSSSHVQSHESVVQTGQSTVLFATTS